MPDPSKVLPQDNLRKFVSKILEVTGQMPSYHITDSINAF